MPYFTWDDALLVGIKNIDEQHKRLVDMINELHDAVRLSGQHCPDPELVARLKTYADEHFHIEEGYMQVFAYPEFKEHQEEHGAFRAAVRSFEDSLHDDSANPAEVLEFLKSWLTYHITEVDIKMGRFLDGHLR